MFALFKSTHYRRPLLGREPINLQADGLPGPLCPESDRKPSQARLLRRAKKRLPHRKSHNYEVSATPCTEDETAHAPSSGVAETLLHEPAVGESSYGDLVMVVAARDRARSCRVAGGNAISLIGWEFAGTAAHILGSKCRVRSWQRKAGHAMPSAAPW